MSNLCFSFTPMCVPVIDEVLAYVQSENVENFTDSSLSEILDSIKALLCISELKLPFALDHIHSAGKAFASLAYNLAYSCILGYDERKAFFAYICHKLSWHLFDLSGLDVDSASRIHLSIAYGIYREGYIDSIDEGWMDYSV